jgi:hypothetical protein
MSKRTNGTPGDLPTLLAANAKARAKPRKQTPGKYDDIIEAYDDEASAIALGATPVPWREAGKGDYAILDDGKVLYIRRVTMYGGKGNGNAKPTIQYITKQGNFWWTGQRPATKCRIESFHKYEWSETKKSLGQIDAMAYVYARTFDRRLAQDIAMGVNPGQHKKPRMRALMKTEKFEVAVKAQLKGILADRGLNEEGVIDLLVEVIESAKTAKNLKVLSTMALKLFEAQGGFDKKVHSLEGNLTEERFLEDADTKATQRLELTEKSTETVRWNEDGEAIGNEE